jgi:hypothetical protein
MILIKFPSEKSRLENLDFPKIKGKEFLRHKVNDVKLEKLKPEDFFKNMQCLNRRSGEAASHIVPRCTLTLTHSHGGGVEGCDLPRRLGLLLCRQHWLLFLPLSRGADQRKI